MEKDLHPVTEPTLTSKQIEKFIDEQTVFALAVMAMDIHMGTLLKNKSLLANSLMKIGVILKNNPGFAVRFKKAQDAIVERMKKETPPEPISTPLPTDVALDIVEPNIAPSVQSVPEL